MLDEFQSQLMQHYEKNCLAEYASPNEDDMVFSGNSKDSLDSIVSKIASFLHGDRQLIIITIEKR